MNNQRRFLAAALALLAAAPAAFAQNAPVPPLIKLIVPFAPGASTDVTARALAAKIGPKLGTNIVVENKAGASGMIGAQAVVNGPKDGSQLLFTSISMVTTAATTRNSPFDVTKDLVPVAILYDAPLIIAVSAKTEIRTPADLLAAARARPDQVTHGTGGIGTTAHLAAELLNDAARIQLKHVPYKGASLAVTDAVGGTIDAIFAVNSTFSPQILSGRLRPIAVTSAQPSPAFPKLPTMASVVPGYNVTLWTGVFAPAGAPPALAQRINHEINEAMKSKEMQDILNNDGGTALALTPEESARRVRDAYATWKRVATARKMVLD